MKAKLAVSSALALSLLLSGCSSGGAQPAENKPAQATQSVDTSELRALMEQSTIDIDEYELSGDMLAYTQAVRTYSSLIYDKSATQEDIDNAVAEIKSLREKAIPQESYVEAEPALPLPVYQEMVESIDANLGNKYHIAGRVTHVGGGFRGDDYEVYVYWDDSQTQGEVAAIVIPYKSYTESVNRYFEGDCTLQGLDDSGHPQFVCYEYIAVEP